MQLWWVSQDTAVVMNTLAPGQTIPLITYVGHHFVVTRIGLSGSQGPTECDDCSEDVVASFEVVAENDRPGGSILSAERTGIVLENPVPQVPENGLETPSPAPGT